MRKIVAVCTLLVAFLLPISAKATPRASKVLPNITFDGNIATCSVSVFGDNTHDTISLTAKLWMGSECLATWNESGAGFLSFSTTKNVQKGKTYKLTADVTINGKMLDTVSATGTCK